MPQGMSGRSSSVYDCSLFVARTTSPDVTWVWAMGNVFATGGGFDELSALVNNPNFGDVHRGQESPVLGIGWARGHSFRFRSRHRSYGGSFL